MIKSILLAGMGGQGILFAGKQLALAGMYSDKKVTWLPSYGAESRGGTSNCTVVISDEEIGSPVVANPDILFVMNMPSYRKFAGTVAAGGIIIGDSSLITEKCGRGDISEHYIPATSIAYEKDMLKLANVIMLGKLIKITGVFTHDELVDSMRKTIPESKKDLLELNIKALEIGLQHE